MPFLNGSDELWLALQAIAAEDALEVYDVERRGVSALRVIIERAHAADESLAQGGVTSGDCSGLCRRLMVYFSVEGPRFGLGCEPEIEVSSPGVNRHLRLERHFESAIGKRVKLVLRNEPHGEVETDFSNGSGDEQSLEKPRGGGLSGVLRSVSSSELRVLEERSGEEVSVDRKSVKSARLDFKF